MVRPTASPLRRLAAAPEPCPAARQRRHKTFARHVDKDNQVYYTFANRRPLPDPASPPQYDFFSMPDLLLDLDAEGSSAVRPFDDEADGKRLRERWPADTPRREAARATARRFEQQVYESRRKTREICSQPTNVWRITPHDVLSAALLGSPPPSEGPVAPTSCEAPPGAPAMGVLERLRIENGIPPHAAKDDEQLLRWMLLRQQMLDKSRLSRDEAAPSPSQLAQALRKQTSMTGIRRLVCQCLGAGTSVACFTAQQGPEPDMAVELRRACERVLGVASASRDERLQALATLGNLSERLAAAGASMGAPLLGLCLRLSAEAALPEASSEWLHRGFDADAWSANAQTSRDVASTLDAFGSLLAGGGEPGVDTAPMRQLLLQLLTGIDENDCIAPASLRALTVPYLELDGPVPAQQALGAYSSYVALLGQLGAVRTLWKEWRLSAPQARALAGPHGAGAVEAAFADALRRAAHGVTAAGYGETGADASLEQCVVLDYHAMDEAGHASGAGGGPSDTGRAPHPDGVAAVLDMPLDGCMSEVQRMPSVQG